MTLKIVDREDFSKMVSQWVQLHSIMEDDDREDVDGTGNDNIRSPTSPSGMGGLGSPKGKSPPVITQV